VYPVIIRVQENISTGYSRSRNGRAVLYGLQMADAALDADKEGARAEQGLCLVESFADTHGPGAEEEKITTADRCRISGCGYNNLSGLAPIFQDKTFTVELPDAIMPVLEQSQFILWSQNGRYTGRQQTAHGPGSGNNNAHKIKCCSTGTAYLLNFSVLNDYFVLVAGTEVLL
jgi:hypothetical protein